MTIYKEELEKANLILSKKDNAIFIGYGLEKGRALGTLASVERAKIIETLVAENLMVGLGIGMALKGFFPIIFIERMDFILNAMDAIVNHLSVVSRLSKNEFNPAMIIRVVVGNKNKPLYTGLVHTQDFSDPISEMVNFPVVKLTSPDLIIKEYEKAYERFLNGTSTIIVEYKDLI
jgi:pyruvate/2-oxoglutarate/acetoin dehydrogenase E1 component